MNEADQLDRIDQHFGESTTVFLQLQNQHNDVLRECLQVKSTLDKLHSSLLKEENHHLHREIKRMQAKIDGFYRTETLAHTKIDPQNRLLQEWR
jgi:hypothetical protein